MQIFGNFIEMNKGSKQNWTFYLNSAGCCFSY